jgi:hypothetical protein
MENLGTDLDGLRTKPRANPSWGGNNVEKTRMTNEDFIFLLMTLSVLRLHNVKTDGDEDTYNV